MGKLILFTAILIVAFFALRDVYLWYTKTNEIINNQNETNRLLRKLAGEQEPEENKTKE